MRIRTRTKLMVGERILGVTNVRKKAAVATALSWAIGGNTARRRKFNGVLDAGSKAKFAQRARNVQKIRERNKIGNRKWNRKSKDD